MKLSKTTWIFLAAGAFLIAAVILGWIYLQLMDQQQQTARSLSQAQKTLTGIIFTDLLAKKTPLAQQIDQYYSDITDTRNQLSSAKDSIDATNAILADAKACSANVTVVTSPGLGAEDLSGIKCETLTASIQAYGDLYHLSNFISSLSRVFPSSVVKSASIGGDKINGLEFYTSTINLVIYNYKGD